MKIHPLIKQAMAASQKPGGPTNLFKFNLTELKKLGYKQKSAKDEWEDGDIIVADDTGQSVFIFVDCAKHLRKSLRSETIKSTTLQVYHNDKSKN